MALIVAECGDMGDSFDADVEIEPWEEQVPLLNGALRSLGIEGRGWAGRTVKIRRVLERWCVFRRYDDGNTDEANEAGNDEEMAQAVDRNDESHNETMLEI